MVNNTADALANALTWHDTMRGAALQLADISEWIDKGNAHRDAEARTWGRLAKLTEEAGEVIAAYIGHTGQNPRKGVTHTSADVVKELLDVAVTALGAVEHITGHDVTALDRLAQHIDGVWRRAFPTPPAAVDVPTATTEELA